MSQRKHFDVVIVGGGMVGLCLALAIKDFLRVAIIESRALTQNNNEQQHDLRALSLAHSTQQILAALDIWPEIKHAAIPLREIHISERGRFGVTRLKSEEYHYEQFGAVVPAQLLGNVLLEKARQSPQIEFIAPAIIDSIVADSAQAYLTGKELDLSCEIAVIASGANSPIAKNAGFVYHTENKGQQALVTTVQVSKPQAFVAYERFIKQGIIALLPLAESYYGLVWAAPEADVQALQNRSEINFLAALQTTFGYRVGRFEKLITLRQNYPLQTIVAQKEISDRAILLGNAAHTLHPAAAQGLNLALRRAAVLAEELVRARSLQQDLANPEVLGRYIERTQQDTKQVMRFTDGLVKLFSHDNDLLGKLRGLGLFLFDRATPLKRTFTQQAMGLSNSASCLTHGQSLSEEMFV